MDDALVKTRSMKIQIVYKAQIIRRLPPRVLSCAICNLVWPKKRFGLGPAWVNAIQEPADRSRRTNPDVLRRIRGTKAFCRKLWISWAGGKLGGNEEGNQKRFCTNWKWDDGEIFGNFQNLNLKIVEIQNPLNVLREDNCIYWGAWSNGCQFSDGMTSTEPWQSFSI